MLIKKYFQSVVLSFFYASFSFSQIAPEAGSRAYYDLQLRDHTSDLKPYVLLELDRLANAASVSKLNSFLSALESMSNKDKQSVLEVFKRVLEPDEDLEESYPHIYMISDLVGMGLEVTNDQLKIVENIYRSSELIKEELHAARTKEETYIKSSELKQITSKPVDAEWKKLKERNFRQGPEASSCALYSLLYAIKKHKVLGPLFSKQVIASITKDQQGNYYVLEQEKPRFFKPSFLKAADPLMHPASSSVIKIISYLVLEKMGITSPAFYVIADPKTGKDHLFDKPVLGLGQAFIIEDHEPSDSKPAAQPQVVLKKDGSVLFHSDNSQKQLSGDFVLSVATNKWGGHAVSVFFDQKTKNWKLYDNLRGVMELSHKRLPEQVIQQIFAVGFWEIKPMITRN